MGNPDEEGEFSGEAVMERNGGAQGGEGVATESVKEGEVVEPPAAENYAAQDEAVCMETVEEGEVVERPAEENFAARGDEAVSVESGEQGEVVESPAADDEEAQREGIESVEDGIPKQLTRSGQKALAKSQWYKEKKAARKAMEKEKRHQETERKRREWEEKLATLTEEEKEKAKQERLDQRKGRKDEQKQRKERLREALAAGQNLVIDLEFSELMKPTELTSLIQQVMYSYAANARADEPGRITLTGVNGAIKTQLEKISGYTNWLLHREENSYLEVFKDRKEDLVYLTADSENILTELDKSKIYIVGGLVDRNRWKNITLDKANNQGIVTAKLPVSDHLKMMGSQVLTVNQVIELLLCFMKLKDWKQTLLKVVPQRKRAAERNAEEEQVVSD